jgi:hypothetical protein
LIRGATPGDHEDVWQVIEPLFYPQNGKHSGGPSRLRGRLI